jgi:phosphoglucomutase
MIDKVCEDNGIKILETPVGFKWFVEPMSDGDIFFGGEESAGASFLRKDRGVWSTDKDGIIMNLLSVEMLAKNGYDAGISYEKLTQKFANPIYARLDAVASYEQKEILKNLSPDDIKTTSLANETIEKIITVADNGAKIGGLKVVAKNGWFAIRPSGTEDVYKIYAESFIDENHLQTIQKEAKEIVDTLFS